MKSPGATTSIGGKNKTKESRAVLEGWRDIFGKLVKHKERYPNVATSIVMYFKTLGQSQN